MVEHATLADVSDANTLGEAARARLAEHLSHFLKPKLADNCVQCPCCGGALWHGGGVLDALCSTFRWGLAHGDGFCGRCKWPVRFYHYLQLDGERRIVFPLAYRCFRKDTGEEIDPTVERASRLADAEA